ncbi:MAG: metal ABC transporter substrate-binding protein [Phycisphaerales bacterium]|jgi:zinc transport system substrate-binding protein|nr:metal ABC transporter substrate-binding protein [Phycisphaerales bacterium]
MSVIRTPVILSSLLITCMLAACDRSSPSTAMSTQTEPTTPKVFAINFPLQSFATQIGGDLIQVEVPKVDGFSASLYNPSPEEIITIQDANLILLNGADFSPWTGRASLPASKTVITSRSFKKEWLESSHDHGDHDHQHGPEGEGVHSHAHWAAFTWLSPMNAKRQAASVGQALGRLLSADAAVVEQRSKDLQGSFDPLIKQAERISGMTMPTLIASEPQYQYLAKACGVEVLEADWHWNEPAPHAGMDSLRALVEASGAGHILVPSEPSAERSATLKQMNLEAVVIPLLVDPRSGDSATTFVEALGRNLDTLEALGSAQPTG